MSDNKRIAKNTIFLYVRMVIILVVGLFTSRIVLNALGVENYGIYNVVGGFVTIFGFLNGAMANASQRFLTFELAQGNLERQILTFSTSINLHIILAFIIIILSESIGLWFFYNKLAIPADRLQAALWVYQLSIVTVSLAVISVPYNALIIAHERMSAFAWISMLDVALKLAIIYLLINTTFDKLIFYAVLLFCVQVLDQVIYWIFCIKNFPEARYRFAFDRKIFKGMSNIAGWSLFGNIAGVGYTQGLNILLNMFFGPVVNAARGIAVTVQGVVSGFVSNIQMAINPQITKCYATNDIKRMHNLIFASSKYCFFLLLIVVMPILIKTYDILKAWLSIVPEYTVWFVRLTLCVMLVETLANPLMVSSQAVGRVKVYQSVVGGILLFIVPVAYVCLKMGASPISVFIVQLIMFMIATLFRIMIVGRMIDISLSLYLKDVVSRIIFVFIFSLFISMIISAIMPHTVSGNIITIILIPIVISAISLMIGLNNHERMYIFSSLKNLRKRFRLG